MIASESLDALAILSPKDTHEKYLRAACEAGLHVLCEKPFIALGEDGCAAERSQDIVDAFREKGLSLWENCQWPFTLPAYAALFPQVLSSDRVPRSFEMRLAPTRRDGSMVEEVISHALSLLQAACGAEEAEVDGIRFEALAPGGVRLCFDFATPRETVACRVDLIPRDGATPSMGYGFDGQFGERSVEPETYALSFQGDGREVRMDDPLGLMVESFTRVLKGAPPERGEWHPGLGIAPRMAMLSRLQEAIRSCGIQELEAF